MPATSAPREEFLAQLAASVHDGSFVKLTLGKPRGADATLRNVFVRPITLRGAPHFSFLWRHDQRDITKNLGSADALALIAEQLGLVFHSAHLFTTARMVQLEFNKKGEPRLTSGKAAPVAPASETHDHIKHRLLPAESQRWLEKLGVTTSTGSVRTGMADKHRQIHKFTEILSHLVAEANLLPPSAGRANRPGEPRPLDLLGALSLPKRLGEDASPYQSQTDRPLEIADMGCGKGYLTFAAHDYFNRVAGRPANVHGVESRPGLVDTCNRIARECGCARLDFTAGTIESAKFPALDVLIALHACDTATDDAIAVGIAANATLIVIAPCCQKELRPQLHAAPVLAPALRHGIFQERHAEFATDALRALLLEWAGYDTKVFEFISTEHTVKNVMIAATKHTRTARTEEAARAVRDLAAFYGIRTQALARQLGVNLDSSSQP